MNTVNIITRSLYIAFISLVILTIWGCDGSIQDREEQVLNQIIQQRKATRNDVEIAIVRTNNELSRQVYRAILAYQKRSAVLLDIGEDLQDTDIGVIQTNLVPNKEEEAQLRNVIKNQITQTKHDYQRMLRSNISEETKAKLYMLLPALQNQLDDLDQLERHPGLE